MDGRVSRRYSCAGRFEPVWNGQSGFLFCTVLDRLITLFPARMQEAKTPDQNAPPVKVVDPQFTDNLRASLDGAADRVRCGDISSSSQLGLANGWLGEERAPRS